MANITHFSAIKGLEAGEESISICRQAYTITDEMVPMCPECAIIAKDDNISLGQVALALNEGLGMVYKQVKQMKAYLESVQKILSMIGAKDKNYKCCEHCEHSLYPDKDIDKDAVDGHGAPCKVPHCTEGKVDTNEGAYAVKLHEAMDDVFKKIMDNKDL